jgi:hypothetical protein
VVGTHDIEGIARGLGRLAKAEVGRPNQETADSYSWPVIAERLVRVMEGAIAGRRVGSGG